MCSDPTCTGRNCSWLTVKMESLLMLTCPRRTNEDVRLLLLCLLLPHSGVCASIFLANGIGPSLARSPAEREFRAAAVNFPLLCKSDLCSLLRVWTLDAFHGRRIVQEETLHIKQKFMKKILSQFPHFSCFHLLSNRVLIHPPTPLHL